MPRILTLICLLNIASTTRGQSSIPDSAEMIMISYRVLPALDKHGLPKVNSSGMETFFMILWKNLIIIKELSKSATYTYRLFDLDEHVFWHCEAVEGVVFRRLPEELEVSENVIIELADKRRILGMHVFKCQVEVGPEDSLTAWQTLEFGRNFSTIGALPGLPLYYEKYVYGDKMRFVAESIDTLKMATEFFNAVRMPVTLLAGYSALDFFGFVARSQIRHGVVMPVLNNKSVQGESIRVPVRDKAGLYFFFQTADARSGLARLGVRILNSYAGKLPVMAIADTKIPGSHTYLPELLDTCPVIQNAKKYFDDIGIAATAYFLVVDGDGFVNEFIFPQMDGWEELLSKSIEKVLR